jgi:endonuclease YncB( thermonuclease family)
MTKGLLLVTGTIDVTQFWPGKESDADTVKVEVSRGDVNKGGFRFSPDGKPASAEVTHVLDSPLVIGAETKEVSQAIITVRLENIDAPELHYLGAKNFRQYFGETAAIALHDLIADAGKNPVHCEVRTRVNHPNDVFDTYGRLIGNIILHPNTKKELNVNHWLIQNGWALPAFYNSALEEEIKEVKKYAEEAQNAGKGIWPHLSKDVGHPDFSLVFRKGGPADPKADIGPVVVPKMFRREVAWQKSHSLGTFRDYLAQQEDGWVETATFLQNQSVEPSKKNLASMVDDKGMLTVDPADAVFFEKASTLADAWGRDIDSWWGEFERAKVVKGAA